MSQELMNNTKMKEDVTKRTACMKVFENADHSLTAAIYGTPVHYMKDGRWEEIDNRLEAVEDEPPSGDEAVQEEDAAAAVHQSADGGNAKAMEAGETAAEFFNAEASDAADAGDDDGTGGDVANIAGSFHVRLSNKVKKKNMVRLGEGSRKFSWGFVDAHSVKRQILKETEDVTGEQKAEDLQEAQAGGMDDGAASADNAGNGNAERTDPTAAYAVPHLESRVLYPEAFDGVDIRYTIGPDSLKEDLVLKHAEAVKAFTWRYAPGELRARQDGADVVFEDTEGKEAYRLSAPYMKDAAGSMSSGLTLTLTDDGGKKNKEAYVTLEADSGWLGAEDRVYPVTIDPVVSTPLAYDKIRDCHVSSYYHTDNFYNSHLLKTGRVDGSVLRSYMQFELPAISRADHMVTAARFYLTKYAGTGSALRHIDVHRVSQPWHDESLTWDNRPAYDKRVLDYVMFSTNDAIQMAFDITDLVKFWYREGKNYGLMVKDHDETGNYTEYASADIHKDYASLRPHILIQYVSYAGLEDYWTYHSHSVGRAGTVHVNDSCGNLILVRDTAGLSGSRLPVSVSHIYNSSDAGTDIGYGRGFRLSSYQKMEEVKIDDVTYYRHTDGDGTARYFAKDSKGKWQDEAGIGITLTFDAAHPEAYYVLTDKDGMKRLFSKTDGLLKKLVDASGNTQEISHTGGKVSKMTDPSGRAFTFAYDANGRLASVTAPAGKEASFTYDGSGRLTKITDRDNAVSSYSYNGSHLLTGISDPYGYSLAVSYAKGAGYGASRVASMTEKAGSTEGMRLTMDYGHNRTKFTDEKGRSWYALFDNSGHTVSVRDDNGRGASWKYSSRAARLDAASAMQTTPVQLLKGNCSGLSSWSPYANQQSASVSEDASGGLFGKKAVRIHSTDFSAYGLVVQTVTLVPGKRYVFSAYGKTAAEAVGDRSALVVQAQNTDLEDIIHTKRKMTAGTTDWQRLQVAFTAPAAADGGSTVKVRIVARAIYFKGDAWFDGFQLEEGEAASRFNLLVNNTFGYDLYGLAKSGNADDNDKVVTVSGNGGRVRLTGTVIKGDINLRERADAGSSLVMVLPKGTKADVLGADYDASGARWYALRGSVSGKDFYGYMLETYVSLNGPGETAAVRGIAAGNDLNVRKGPGSSYGAMTRISRGTPLMVTAAGRDGSGVKWYLANFTKGGGDYTGYISSEYMAIYYPEVRKGKAKEDIYLRVGPGRDYDSALTLHKDAVFDIQAHTERASGDQWYYVKGTKGETAYTGYVMASFVTVTGKGTASGHQVPGPVGRPAPSGTLGSRVFKIEGDETSKKRLVYTLNVSGKKGDVYMAGAWGCAESLPLTGTGSEGRHFGICVNFTAADGKEEAHYADFGPDTGSWQYLNEAFVAGQDYDKIYVCYCYYKNANTAYFTGLSLFREAYGTSFVYDDKGNVVKVTDQAKKNSRFEYDSAGNIAKLIDIKGNYFEYTHDDKHRLTGAKSAMNMKYSFAYNDHGGISSAKVVDPSNTAKAITATAEYTKDGNYIYKLCDEDGNSTSYGWDTAKGWMTSVTDGEGNRTDYTYDVCNRVTKVTSPANINDKEQKISVAYTYKNNRMTQIEHNGFVYELLYDGFGKETAVKIAGTQAVGHTYDSRNGLLRSTAYANGFSIRYEYDTLDRLQKMEALKDSSVIYTCRLAYDKQGQICRRELEGDKSCTWTYEYDLLGRIGKAVSNNGEERLYHYDANGNVDSVTMVCDGNKQTTVYTFDKDDRETKLQAGSAVVSRTYDVYGRRHISDRGSGAFKTIYRYAVNSAGQPVNRMEAVENNGKKIQYTYDNNGNIKTIQDAVGVTTYHYDALQRLIREDNARLNKTIIYTRDAGGNVTQKKVYALSAQENPEGQPEHTVVYAYADGWKDQMTAVDGQAVVYDAAGNVTAYKGRKYSWCGNGILKDVTKEDGTQIHYAVNAEGVRMEKKVNGVVIATYFTDGSQILGEKNASGYQSYIYNSGGEIEAIYYKKNVYYYIKNGQQDIIGLCDASGQWVVDYSYDTWGNLLKTGGSMASTLGLDNPFRYRGYYYDTETGLYYLESRYYNPELGRMMSADSLSVLGMSKTTLNDKNLYNYCDGNPVGRLDESGKFPVDILIQGAIGGVIGFASGVMTAGAVAEIEGRKVTTREVVNSAVTGFLTGAFSGMIKSKGIAWIVNIAITGAVTAYATDGSVKDKLGAALNDMTKVAITSVAFGVELPILEDMGNTILSSAVGGIYDMAVAKANRSRKNSIASSATSKSGYSGRWLVSEERRYTGSGRFCWEICTKYYSDGSISVERRKYTI